MFEAQGSISSILENVRIRWGGGGEGKIGREGEAGEKREVGREG